MAQRKAGKPLQAHALVPIHPETRTLSRGPLHWAPDEIQGALERGRNPHTVRSDLKGIRAFGEWLGVGSFKETCERLLFAGATTEERQGNANRLASRYRAHLFETGYAPSTIKRRLDSVKSIVRIARIFGMVPWELELESVPIQAYRDTHGPGETPFEDVILKLEKETDPLSVRDLAVLVCLHDLALRRDELISADLEHVDFSLHFLWVKAKKRLERENVALSPAIEEVLRRWIKIRGEQPGPLFQSLVQSDGQGGRLDGSSLWRITKRYGLGHPHGLRHLGITEYARHEKSVIKVMKFARHRDPKTTMIYIDNLKEASTEAAVHLAGLREKRRKEKDELSRQP